jgi:hypothetical protein
LKRCKHENYWLVQLATETKRKINELVKDCLVIMNGISTNTYLNIMSLGSYDFSIGMDYMGKHHVFLDFYNKDFTCLDEEGNSRMMQVIPRPISIREVSSLHLKISFRKG